MILVRDKQNAELDHLILRYVKVTNMESVKHGKYECNGVLCECDATDILSVSVSYDASTHFIRTFLPHHSSPSHTRAQTFAHVIDTHTRTYLLQTRDIHTLAERCCGNVHRQSLSLCIRITYNSIYTTYLFGPFLN